MFKKIDHVGIAVNSIEEAVKNYELLGLKCKGIEELKERGLKVAIFQIGDNKIEFLQSLNKETAISKFLEKRGEGIHHIALEVKEIEKKLEEFKTKGIALIDEKVKIGVHGSKIAFISPKSLNGVLLELVERE